jgi:hypothetical protein
MKNLSLIIDTTELQLGEEEKKITVPELVCRVITNVIVAYANQNRGLLQNERKTFYFINDELDKAIADKTEVVSLGDGDIGFIRKCFRETRLNPSALLKSVEELIEDIKDR